MKKIWSVFMNNRNYQTKKSKFYFFGLLCMVIFSTFLNAAPSQSDTLKKTITGTVLDNNNQPIPGASVLEKGTSNGTITDVDGKFSLNVGINATVQISYIGFGMQEFTAQNMSVITAQLSSDAQNLDEVVVVGYGQQTKVNLTGAVSSISGKELLDRPITSVSSGIQGMAAGVTITSRGGRPGSDGGTIRIRGVGTYNNANPYILIDGIESGSMDQVDPNDIESISVLKDAASAAIYGSKASNGVILITTKRGKEGRPILSYSANTGWQNPTGLVERMNSYDAGRFYNMALEGNGKASKYSAIELEKFRDGSEPYKYPNTDWNKLGYRKNTFLQQHNVNISGGTEHLKYVTSVGFLSQNGILRNSGRRQFNARTNLDIKLSKYFTVRSNLSYINNFYQDANSSYGGGEGSSEQIIRQMNRIAPWIVNQYEDGTYGTFGDGNPIAWLDLNQTIDRKNQNFAGIVAVDYTVFTGLKLTVQGSYVGNLQDYKAFVKEIQYNPQLYHGPNELKEATYLWNRATFDATLNYDKSFDAHNIKVMLGHRSEAYNYKENTSTRQKFPNNYLTDMNAGDESTQKNTGFTRSLAMVSYFGRVNYDYMSKYLLEANFRADASSRFNPQYRWGYFPAFSAGWRISEEAFMESTKDWLQQLKFRGSWGQLGNQDALKEYYPYMITYAVGTNYPFDGKLNRGMSQKQHRLSSIGWERSTTWGVGFDAILFQGFTVNFDYYNRLTRDIIMDVPTSETFGLGTYKANVGSMVNRGIEIMAGYQKRWTDWRFSVNANFAMNRNEILDLGGVKENIVNYYQINRVGEPYEAYYLYTSDGLFQSQQEADEYTAKYGNPFGKDFKAGDIRYKDTNGDGKLTPDDRQVTYADQPKFTYGFNSTVGWKGVDVSFLFQGAIGVSRYYNNEIIGDFSGDTSHPSTAWLDAWSLTNPNGKFPRVSEANSSPSHPTIPSDFWVFTANYLRLKNIQIGYTFPEHWISKFGVSRLRVYYSGENLFTFHNLPINVDPEAPSGRGAHYPILSINSIGLNLTF